ncbi:MFS transporter [Luteipulveratus sp. YIM 133132]|uniref:MFS transporter n=1 Tax=Luteipulveratus flavus TaxID=3031728 RepID=UPI0023B131BA|nr:MFS transporter [Luteipulveratus sp. YIM 133132]MDE9367204.1 MFS transporter [Luteipulveratus sp. YIM 133132]
MRRLGSEDSAGTRESDPSSPSGEETADPPDPRRWRILGVTLTVGFMVLLDVTIVNVAIPSMQQGLRTSAAQIQWVVSGYALALGLVLVTGGRLGDAWGRRRLMLIGLTGFILASAATGLAPNVAVVVTARLVQGFAAGLLTPQSSGLIQSLFRGPERGIAFGLFGFTVSVSSAIGPVVGGLLIAAFGEDTGWRWIFLVNVPIGLVLLAAIARLVPERSADDGPPDTRLDLVGAALLGATVLAVLYPVVNLESGSRLPLLLLALVPVLAVGFVRWEQRLVRTGGAPLLDLGLLREVTGYASGVLIGSIYFTGFTGVFLVLSVYLQEGLGYSALHAGLLLTPFAAGSAIAAPLAGRLVSRVGRVLTVIALVVMVVGLAGIVVLAPAAQADGRFWLLALPLLAAGLGGGGVVSPNITLSLASVPTRMGGAAGGALQTGQRIGASIGAALVMTTYQIAVGRLDDPGSALRVALGISMVLLLAATAVAVWSWRREPALPEPA